MKRACILWVPALFILAVASGCNDEESKPNFTRLRVTPQCGVAPMDVEGYAVVSGGNESGDPMGANNNLDIQWAFGDGGTGSTTLAYHRYFTPGEYTVTVVGTDPDGNSATSSIPVLVLPDSLVMQAGSNFPDGNVTTADTVRFDISAFSCDIDFPAVPGDAVKMEFLWSMGDDAATEYTLPDPEFRYFTPGTYDATVTVFYPAWAVYRHQTLTFNVTDP
jgi:PKD repeat protein